MSEDGSGSERRSTFGSMNESTNGTTGGSRSVGVVADEINYGSGSDDGSLSQRALFSRASSSGSSCQGRLSFKGLGGAHPYKGRGKTPPRSECFRSTHQAQGKQAQAQQTRQLRPLSASSLGRGPSSAVALEFYRAYYGGNNEPGRSCQKSGSKGDRSSKSAGPKSRMMAERHAGNLPFMRPKSAGPLRRKHNMDRLHPKPNCETSRMSKASVGPSVGNARRPVSARPASKIGSNQKSNKKKGAMQTNQSFSYLREREDSWDAGFVKSRPLDTDSAAGSGYRALRSKKLSKSQSEYILGRGKAKRVSKRKKKSSVSGTQGAKKAPRSRFRALYSAVTKLWEQLHVPDRDREFFHEAYCASAKAARRDPKTLARLTEQHELLLKHRDTTINVLKKIESREQLLTTLRRLSVKQKNLGPNKSGEKSTEREGEQEDKVTQEKQPETEERQDGEPEEIFVVANKLRMASLAVVRTIEEWRRVLWRPHPFIWQDVNYLIKMQTDCKFYCKMIDDSCFDAVFFSDSAQCLREEDLDQNEIDTIRKTLTEEAALQCELRAEHKRLTTAGYYIPMLRWSPEELGQRHTVSDTKTHPELERDTVNADTRTEDGASLFDEFKESDRDSCTDSACNPSFKLRHKRGSKSSKSSSLVAIAPSPSPSQYDEDEFENYDKYEEDESEKECNGGDDALRTAQKHIELLQRLRAQIQENQ